MQLSSARKMKPDRFRTGPRRNHKVIFQLPLVAVIDQINAGIHTGVLDFGISRYSTVPLGRVIAEEVVSCAGQGIAAGYSNSAAGAGQLHPHYIGLRSVARRSRLKYIAGLPAGLRIGAIRLAQRQHRRRIREKQRISAASRKELHRLVGLTLVGLKAERDSSVVLRRVRLFHRKVFIWLRGRARGERRERGCRDESLHKQSSQWGRVNAQEHKCLLLRPARLAWRVGSTDWG